MHDLGIHVQGWSLEGRGHSTHDLRFLLPVYFLVSIVYDLMSTCLHVYIQKSILLGQKLAMMQVIAQKRGDTMSRFQNSLYLGDIQARVAVLRETGQCKIQSSLPARSSRLTSRPPRILHCQDQRTGRYRSRHP